jgi:hypothetical protein
MLRIGLQLKKAQPENKGKLEYFRKKILDHLSKLEKQEEKSVSKAMAFFEFLKKGGFPVGTIRTWNGVKHIKMPDGKWRPKYDSQTRGAKMAISLLKKKIAAAKDEHEMMQIILANRDRFNDQYGHPLPFVQELHNYIEEQKTVKQEPTRRSGRSSKDKKEYFNVLTPQQANYLRLTGDDGRKRLFENRTEEWYSDGRLSRKEAIEKLVSSAGLELRIAEGRVDKWDRDNGKPIEPDVNKQDIKPAQTAALKPSGKPDKSRRQFSLEELDAGIKEGLFTFGDNMDELLGSLYDDEILCGYTASTWREAAEASRKYNAGELSGGDYKTLMDKLWDENLVDKERRSFQIPKPAETPDNKADDSQDDTDFQSIKNKYQSAKAIEGDEDEVQIGKDTLSGKWKLVEADTPTASHNETTFHKTPGFPTNDDGSTINDRDYGHDKAAQDAVMDIGSDFDGRALRVDNPVIVTTDGVVISGNNRTMSSKIAAKKGTDIKYIEALKKRAKKFGFAAEQVGEFKNPRVVFEVKQEGKYTTEQFSKFNESGKKEMGPTEKAVKVSKLIKPETVTAVAEKIGEFETLGELYADRGAVQHIFSAFKNSGLVGEFEIGKYIENGSITEDGKTFIETALLGSVMNENNIRGFNRPGCKSIRAMLVRAITPLIENKSMGGYSITRELNEAADIAMQVAIERDKFKSVEEFSKQQSMFEKFDPVSVELAKKLEGTQKLFAEFMQKMNGSLKYAANGEADIFLGDVESKEDILGRFLEIKKAVVEVLDSVKGLEGVSYENWYSHRREAG